MRVIVGHLAAWDMEADLSEVAWVPKAAFSKSTIQDNVGA